MFIKDESSNPTGSFKARGLAVAVGRALELGRKEFVIPTAGNVGSALAFYAARAGARAHVFMPKNALCANQEERVELWREIATGGRVDQRGGLFGWRGGPPPPLVLRLDVQGAVPLGG